MKFTIDRKKIIIFCCFLLLTSLKSAKPATAQSTSNSGAKVENTFVEADKKTREKLERVTDEVGDVREAINEQEKNLTEQIEEKLPQKEIQAARGIFNTIDAVIDFFGGLSFDDFFGGISLENILDDIFNSASNNSRGESVNSNGSSEVESSSNSDQSFSIEAGAIGLLDPRKVAEAIKAKKTSTAEELLGAKTGGTGSVTIKDDLRTFVQVKEAKEVAQASALSNQAQEKLKKKSNAATEALKQSTELAQDSEGQDVTQNIMRNISSQLGLLQRTNTILGLNAQIQQRDAAIANALLAESVRELNGERVAKNRELASAYSAVITHGAQFTLPGLTNKR